MKYDLGYQEHNERKLEVETTESHMEISDGISTIKVERRMYEWLQTIIEHEIVVGP